MKFKIGSFLSFIFVCFALTAIKAQALPFYNVLPITDDGYFTKTVFHFNPVFIKKNKVKSIGLSANEDSGIGYLYNFDSNGLLQSRTRTRYGNGKIDTAFYTRYYYNSKGLLDKRAKVDYRDGIIKVDSYHYDDKDRIAIIQIFSLNSQMPDRLQNSDWQGERVPRVDKMIIRGDLPDESLWKKMTAANEFSSFQYRYYVENKFDVEEVSEYYNFQKNTNAADNCHQKRTTYYQNSHPRALFIHNGCDDKKIPSELYRTQDGVLVELIDAPGSPEIRTEKYTYNEGKNLLQMDNIWSGQKVSELKMMYDSKGFLTSVQRKSEGLRMIQYFEDRTLKVTYQFY